MSWIKRLAAGWLIPATLVLCSCSGSVGEEEGSSPKPLITVEVETPRREPMERRIQLAASIEANQTAPLYAKATGYVKSISVDIGDRVERGQALLTLDIPEMTEQHAQAQSALAEREAELTKARAQAELQRAILRRSELLRRDEAITEQSLDEERAKSIKTRAQVRVAKARQEKARARVAEIQALMEYATITSPFDGIVTERFVDEGTLVRGDTSGREVSPLLTVAQIDTVRVLADVPEPDVPSINKEDRAVLELSALPGRPFEGSVTRFARALDETSRTMRTEVDLPNAGGSLLPGMFGTLTIVLQTKSRALTVSQGAIRKDQRGTFLFVVEDGRARRKGVRTGLAAGERVEIVEGIDGGVPVVTLPTGPIAEGEPVQVAGGEAKAQPESGP